MSAVEVNAESLSVLEVDIESLSAAEVDIESLPASKADVELMVRFVKVEDVLHGDRHRCHVAGPDPGARIYPSTSVSEQKGPEASEPGAEEGNWQR